MIFLYQMSSCHHLLHISEQVFDPEGDFAGSDDKPNYIIITGHINCSTALMH